MKSRKPSPFLILMGIAAACVLLSESTWGRSEFRQTFEVPENAQISLTLDSGAITVSAHERAELLLQGQLSRGQLELIIDGLPASLDLMPASEQDYSQSRVHVTLPSRSSLLVRSESADITVHGMQGSFVNISGGQGLVTVENALPNRLHVTTLDGSQVISSSGKSSTRLHSIAGSIEASKLIGSIDIQTHSGPINLLGTDIQSLNVETVSGRVQALITPRTDGVIHISTHDSDLMLSVPEQTALNADIYSHSGVIETDFDAERLTDNQIQVHRGRASIQTNLLSFSGAIKLTGHKPLAQDLVPVLVLRREPGQARVANFGFDRTRAISLQVGDYGLIQVPRSASTLFARAETQHDSDDHGYSVLEVEAWGDGLNCFEIKPDFADTSLTMLTDLPARIYRVARQFELTPVACPSEQALAKLTEVESTTGFGFD